MKHIESWDVEPARVVRSLLKPTAKVPSTFWEVFMASLHDGDATGVWYCLSSGVAKVALPASVILALMHGFRSGRVEGWGAVCLHGGACLRSNPR